MAKRKRTIDTPVNTSDSGKKNPTPTDGVLIGKAGALELVHRLTLTEKTKKIKIERQPLVQTSPSGETISTPYEPLHGDQSAYQRLIEEVYANPCDWPEPLPDAVQ